MTVSHKRAITKIVDPIHGHLAFNSIETEIIDSRYFQRLHCVLQNSTTYAAYPSNKTSRFIHSLGVAKVSGDVLVNALNNCSADALRAFLENFAAFINHHFFPEPRAQFRDRDKEQKIRGWKKTVQGRSNFCHQPFLKSYDEVADSSETFPANAKDDKGKADGFPAAFLVDTLWVATRVCGLLHDAGHLPMSHSFEGGISSVDVLFSVYPDEDSRAEHYTKVQAHEISGIDRSTNENIFGNFRKSIEAYFNVDDVSIRDFLRSIELHEKRSLYILNELSKLDREDEEYDEYKTVVFTISFLILFSSIVDSQEIISSKPSSDFDFDTSFFRALKAIIAGEIDADRMDYTIRDGAACGSTIGDFDLQRIVSNAILLGPSDEREGFSIAYYERALSGIERFFAERYDGYKYLIYHRTSSRTEACLQELIGRLLHYSFCHPDSRLTDIISEYGFIYKEPNGDITDIVPMTTASMENFDDSTLRAALFKILRFINKKEGFSKKHDDEKLINIIELLIKVIVFRDYSSIYNPFKNSSFNKYMKNALGKRFDQEKLYKLGSFLNNKFRKPEYIEKFKKITQREFGPEVCAIVQFQQPKIYNWTDLSEYERINIVDRNGNTSYVEDNSFYLREMKRYSVRDMDIKIYFISNSFKESDRCQHEIEGKLSEILLELYGELEHEFANAQS